MNDAAELILPVIGEDDQAHAGQKVARTLCATIKKRADRTARILRDLELNGPAGLFPDDHAARLRLPARREIPGFQPDRVWSRPHQESAALAQPISGQIPVTKVGLQERKMPVTPAPDPPAECLAGWPASGLA